MNSIIRNNSYFNQFGEYVEVELVEIRDAKIVPDLRLFQAQGISKEWGRKVMAELVEKGEISPLMTPTGRCLLSFTDAERLAHEL